MTFIKGNTIGFTTRFQKGQKIRLDIKHTTESKKKIGKAMEGKQNCLGRKLSEKTKKKISEWGIQNTGKRYKKYPNLKKQISEKMSGKNSPFWKGGISFEPYSVNWTETLKRAMRERDRYICQVCNSYGNTVHHIDYDKKNNNPNNLITLCASCHSKTNNNRKYWIKYLFSIS